MKRLIHSILAWCLITCALLFNPVQAQVISGGTSNPNSVPGLPTITITRTPNPMVAGQNYTVRWNTTNADSVHFQCTSSGGGFAGSGDLDVSPNTSTGIADSAWVGHNSTCVWTAYNDVGSKVANETMVTVAPSTPAPTISVSRTPNPMIAGQNQTFTWNTTNATSVSFVCAASGTGYSGNGTQSTVNGTSTSVASAAWVGYPSTCIWTATGPGGSSTTTETLTTVAATPAPTISISRTPNPMVAGQNQTFTWSTTNATSVSFVCSASGTGYSGSGTQSTVNGTSTSVASAAWVGYPSTCIWTASGAGGSSTFTETLTTVAVTPAPTISVQRTPSPLVASQSYTTNWSTTDATSLSYNCTASGTGFAGNASLATSGSSPGTANAAWVGYPSSCTWTAIGVGGTKTYIETMTTVAATPAPTISVQRTPAQMVAGQVQTYTWSSTNATSVAYNCTASGTGYSGSGTQPTVNGTATLVPSASWIGYPSTCTWTASGTGGTQTYSEIWTTVAAAPAETVIYIHTDGLGSPVARTDASGNVISRTRYEPYGMTVDGTTVPDIGFAGHVNDADTGLTYMDARFYDPIAGRFVSVDPIMTDPESGSNFNRFVYAKNSPYNFVDPDGRDASSICNASSCRVALDDQAAASQYPGSSTAPKVGSSRAGWGVAGGMAGGIVAAACDASSGGACVLANPALVAGGAALGAATGVAVSDALDSASVMLAAGYRKFKVQISGGANSAAGGASGDPNNGGNNDEEPKRNKKASSSEVGEQVRTPDSHPEDFNKFEGTKYRNTKTGEIFERSNTNHTDKAGEWKVGSKPGQSPRPTDKITIGSDGRILKF